MAHREHRRSDRGRADHPDHRPHRVRVHHGAAARLRLHRARRLLDVRAHCGGRVAALTWQRRDRTDRVVAARLGHSWRGGVRPGHHGCGADPDHVDRAGRREAACACDRAERRAVRRRGGRPRLPWSHRWPSSGGRRPHSKERPSGCSTCSAARCCGSASSSSAPRSTSSAAGSPATTRRLLRPTTSTLPHGRPRARHTAKRVRRSQTSIRVATWLGCCRCAAWPAPWTWLKLPSGTDSAMRSAIGTNFSVELAGQREHRHVQLHQPVPQRQLRAGAAQSQAVGQTRRPGSRRARPVLPRSALSPAKSGCASHSVEERRSRRRRRRARPVRRRWLVGRRARPRRRCPGARRSAPAARPRVAT